MAITEHNLTGQQLLGLQLQGDENAGDIQNYLTSLKGALDRGEIGIDQYLQMGMPAAEKGYRLADQWSQRGSNQAKDADRFRQGFSNAGFEAHPTADNQFAVLPRVDAKYEQDVRNMLLPAGLTEEQKATYLNDIPQDIKFGTDQFNIEKEGLRQRLQSEKTASTQKSQRASQLSDLASLLSQNANTNFQRSIPQIAENANTAGIFRSTGYGEALAKQQAQLQQDVGSQVAQQGLLDRATETQSLGDILAAQQGYQNAGLQRQFSLEDFASQANLARQLAEIAKPQNPGKTRGEKWAQGINAGANAVNAGSKVASKAATGGAG